MGRLRKKNWDTQTPRQRSQAGDMVLVLMGNQNGVKLCRIFPGKTHPPQQLPAAQPRVHQNSRALARNHGRVTFGSGGENAHAH